MEALEVMGNMKEKAMVLTQDPRYKYSEMAAQNQYIRIGGLGYRSVSLDEKSPLSGYTVKPSESLDKIFLQFKDSKPKPMDVDVLEKKKERRLQSWIIKNALLKNRDMIAALSLADCPYDEILFATDEVSFGAIRCDIVAVCRKGANYYPVLIELKSNRDKSELIRQIRVFCEKIVEYSHEFSELLGILTGIDPGKIMKKEPHKIIIWPLADSEWVNGQSQLSPAAEKTRQDIVDDKKIHLIEYYDFNDSAGIKFKENWSKGQIM